MTRQDFVKGIFSTIASVATSKTFAEVMQLKHDSKLTVLLSDCHINGRTPKHKSYQSDELTKTIAEILKLDPLPARVITFGDFACSIGNRDDYKLARKVLKPLTDAGIQVYNGMGNHDTTKPFFEIFPEYEKFIRIPNEVVFTVDCGDVDFIMLDVIAGNTAKDKSCISKAQQDWISDALPKWKKPVFVCSHYSSRAIKVHGKYLQDLMFASPMTAGYIHGHDHRWRRDMLQKNWQSPRLIKSLCLPSTGHWGDIGWSLMRTQGTTARVELKQRDFWFPIKHSPNPGADHKMWRLNTEENQGASCTFTLPKI